MQAFDDCQTSVFRFTARKATCWHTQALPDGVVNSTHIYKQNMPLAPVE